VEAPANRLTLRGRSGGLAAASAAWPEP
jgi:hypothetical protein